MFNKPNPYRWGFADAVMGRPSASPFKTFEENAKYLKGYLDGKQHTTKKD